MKFWKPKDDDYIYALDLYYMEIVRVKAKYNTSPILPMFSTKVLAQAALRGVKKVLKKARKQ